MHVDLEDNRKVYAETMEAYSKVLHAKIDLMKRKSNQVKEQNRAPLNEQLHVMKENEKDVQNLIRKIYKSDQRSWTGITKEVAAHWHEARQAEAIAASKFLWP